MILFLERRKDQCAFITSEIDGLETRVCGEPTSCSSGSYCPSHAAIAYVKENPKKRGSAGFAFFRRKEPVIAEIPEMT